LRRDTAIAYLATATEQLQLALRLLAHNQAAALSSLERLVDFCEEHPQYAREWPQRNALADIVGAIARAEMSPRLEGRARELMCRVEELGTAVH